MGKEKLTRKGKQEKDIAEALEAYKEKHFAEENLPAFTPTAGPSRLNLLASVASSTLTYLPDHTSKLLPAPPQGYTTEVHVILWPDAWSVVILIPVRTASAVVKGGTHAQDHQSTSRAKLGPPLPSCRY